jgi:hypothetical protein
MKTLLLITALVCLYAPSAQGEIWYKSSSGDTLYVNYSQDALEWAYNNKWLFGNKIRKTGWTINDRTLYRYDPHGNDEAAPVAIDTTTVQYQIQEMRDEIRKLEESVRKLKRMLERKEK